MQYLPSIVRTIFEVITQHLCIQINTADLGNFKTNCKTFC